MTRTLVPGVVAVALALAACVKAPPVLEPDLGIEPPASWTAGPGDPAPVLTAWWTELGDPALGGLVELALRQNRDLRAAAARLDRAAAEARIAGADLRPGLQAGIGGNRRRQVFVGLPIPGEGVPTSTSTQVGISIDLSWEADLWGRVRAGARAAIAEFHATEAELRAARLSLAAQTAKIWFALAEARLQVELAGNSAGNFGALARQIRSRFERGLRPSIELRLALSNEAAALATLEQRRRQLDATLRQLEILLGEYPSAAIDRHFPTGTTLPSPGNIPVGLPSELVQRRPDLIAALERVSAAEQRQLAARRALYPRFRLTAGAGTASDELSGLLDGDFRIWSLVGGLTQPLFQGGRLRAGVDLASAVSDQALATYASAVLGAYAEVETALAGEDYLAVQERHLREATEQLMAAERLAEERYRSGVGDYLSVLESQTRAFESRSRLLQLQRQRLENRVDLHLALGGGFHDVIADAPEATEP